MHDADSKPTILIQLDTDPHPSVFDGVVAVDSGVGFLFRHGGVRPEEVRDLVHGALFTRGGADLARTAILSGVRTSRRRGGATSGEGDVLCDVPRLGPVRPERLEHDGGGGGPRGDRRVGRVAGTGEGRRARGDGPVGQRAARLMARQGASVSVGSRSLDKAKAAAEAISRVVGKPLGAFATSDEAGLLGGLGGASVVVAGGCGGGLAAPGIGSTEFVGLKSRDRPERRPAAGIAGVKATDRDADRDGVRAWGALGVGGTKMKIHKSALKALFEPTTGSSTPRKFRDRPQPGLSPADRPNSRGESSDESRRGAGPGAGPLRGRRSPEES